MNKKTLKALIKLRCGRLQCSCGARYDIVSIVGISEKYALLVLNHKDPPPYDKESYKGLCLFDLKLNKLIVDGTTLGPRSIISKLWGSIPRKEACDNSLY